MVFTNRNVLVCDKIVKLSIVANNSTLHKDTVLDLCTLAYLNASEQYRVLYLALYDTAVSNKRFDTLLSRSYLTGALSLTFV